LLRGRAGMAAREDVLEESVLRREIEIRIRELQRAVSRGEPPVHWKAQRNEIDDLWSRLLKVRAARTSNTGDDDAAR
jgi:hypothetical protein